MPWSHLSRLSICLQCLVRLYCLYVIAVRTYCVYVIASTYLLVRTGKYVRTALYISSSVSSVSSVSSFFSLLLSIFSLSLSVSLFFLPDYLRTLERLAMEWPESLANVGVMGGPTCRPAFERWPNGGRTVAERWPNGFRPVAPGRLRLPNARGGEPASRPFLLFSTDGRALSSGRPTSRAPKIPYSFVTLGEQARPFFQVQHGGRRPDGQCDS